MDDSAILPLSATPSEVRRFISDMLSQMAGMARCIDDRRLEASLRLLAVEAERGVARGS